MSSRYQAHHTHPRDSPQANTSDADAGSFPTGRVPGVFFLLRPGSRKCITAVLRHFSVSTSESQQSLSPKPPLQVGFEAMGSLVVNA